MKNDNAPNATTQASANFLKQRLPIQTKIRSTMNTQRVKQYFHELLITFSILKKEHVEIFEFLKLTGCNIYYLPTKGYFRVWHPDMLTHMDININSVKPVRYGKLPDDKESRFFHEKFHENNFIGTLEETEKFVNS